MALPLSPAACGAVAGKLACHTHEAAVVTSSGHAPNAARRYASFLMGVARGFGLIAGIMSATATGFLISQVGTLPDFPRTCCFPWGAPRTAPMAAPVPQIRRWRVRVPRGDVAGF